MLELIGPDALEADAVVPQCLDNQYVSDSVFLDMVTRGVDYHDKRVQAAREADFRNEFIRSLVYASQVVVQRAYLKNSDFLYKNFHPSEGDSLQAFANLVRSGAMVPFLFKERSLAEGLDFSTRSDGDIAVQALLAEIGDDGQAVRLAVQDAPNEAKAKSMETAFGTGLSRLGHLDDQQRNAMASELFADPSRLQEADAWDVFNDAVDDLARASMDITAHKRRRHRAGDPLVRSPHVARQDVYDRYFAHDGHPDNATHGRFRRPGSDAPFLVELKKYVDLVYNVNLPDHLHRYTFTPTNLPSRLALQDAPGEGFSHEQISQRLTDPEAIEYVRRVFQSRAQGAMALPLLRDLTMADVVEIRLMPEWAVFKDAQGAILKRPLECLDLMPAFQDAFDVFQRALSDWYNGRYQRADTLRSYRNVVSLAIRIGGHLIVVGSGQDGMAGALTDLGVEGLAAAIPQRVKGYAAKLMVGVYDRGGHRLDADHSYSIELMQTSDELMRADVEELLRAVTAGATAALPGADGLLADQGIQ
jgi:hypothetical protein